MKKIIITVVIILSLAAGIVYAGSKTDNGLIEELRIMLTPDPMENNTYDSGECTYYVFDKIKEDGMMIERSWGDAEFWAERAEANGYPVDKQPRPGSLMQTARGEIGHVAYIETVHEDGSFTISEMNYHEPYEVTERKIKKENINDYNYIHPEVNKHTDS